VGGNPDIFGISLAAFHAANAERARRWPHSMLGTSTHDTKRGEDMRARLAVLSEMPEEWARQVQSWSRILRARRGEVEPGAPPDRRDEYLFYQTLLGTWPVELLEDVSDAEALKAYCERVKGAMVKSMREAKIHSTWAAPDSADEEATLSFVTDALDPKRAGNFLANFLPFAARAARLGAWNTLAQTVLKLTLPGMPDLYQGTELWDLSLVDPDNRRPVDYDLRRRLLEEIEAALARDRRGAMQDYAKSWHDARFKLATIATILAHRKETEAFFAEADYRPISAEGPNANQIAGFLRRRGEEAMLTAVARFPARLESSGLEEATVLPLPEGFQRTRWRGLLSGVEHRLSPQPAARDLFATMPAAILVPV
jgi:(1->4)-alpha-D-glucan 1-alpha-D-glucosylmutase